MKDIKPVRPPSKGTNNILCRSGDDAFSYIAVPKCASSAMGSYLRRCGGKAVGRKDALRHPHFTVIRHPVERLVSAYHFGWRKKGMLSPDFESWWFHVKHNPLGLSWDVHTQPTVEILRGTSGYVYQLEQIEEWWPLIGKRWPWAFGFGPLLRTNARRFERVSLPPDVEDDVLENYAEDYFLWLQASL